jgi:hypothetical protein
MINLHNYALLAEQKKYGYDTSIAESIDTINEAGPDMQTQDGLNKVMGGKTDPNYTAQWNQLVDDIAARKKAAGTYTVTIIHDNQKPMVTLEYQIGTDGKPIKTSVKLAAVAAAPAAPASQVVKDAAQKIWVALEGSIFDEDEIAVGNVFRDNITNDADLRSLLSYWKSLKIPFSKSGNSSYNRLSLVKTADAFKNNTASQANCSLQFFLTGLFSKDEISKVNDYISKYSAFRF